MKPTDIWEYIYVGTCLRYLQDSQPEDKVHGKRKGQASLPASFSGSAEQARMPALPGAKQLWL